MNWISKAAGAFKGDDSSGQTFDLYCDCGQQHQGVRRQKWQRIVCRSCGGSLFVLQKDPYPPPKERREVKVAPPVTELEDEAPLEQEAVVEQRAAREKVKKPKGLKAPERRSEQPQPRLHPELVAAPSLKTPRKRSSKPYVFIFLIVAAIASLTLFVVYRNSQKAQAAIDLKDSLDQLPGLIEGGDWVTARNQLETTVRAMEILGRPESEIGPYRQQLRETTAMTALVSQPISDLLNQADEAQSRGKEALQEFQYKVRGQYLFIQGTAVRHMGETKGRVQHQISLPLAIGKKELPAVIVLQSRDLAKALDQQEEADVILAVKVNSIASTAQEWEIQTEPESVVLWSSSKTLTGLGFREEEVAEVHELLEKQAASLGVHDAAPE